MNTKFDVERLFHTVPLTVPGEGEFVNSYGKTVAMFYSGEPYKKRNTTVFCYLGIPEKPMPKGGFPGIVLAHGGGGCAFYEWVEFWNSKGYVAIAPDFSGRQYGSRELDGPAGDKIIKKNPNAGPGGYGSAGDTEETFFDSWVYHSVSSIILAHNLLLENPSVNPAKTVMSGISWGAVLTCITSGVDDRFCAYAPVYGAGYLKSAYCITLSDKSPEELKRWSKYYDPSSYLPQCNKPILFTVGVDDPAFCILSNTASAELCKGEVLYSNRISLTHYHRWKDDEGMAIVGTFLNSIVKNKPLPYSVQSADIIDGKLCAELCGALNVKRARFCYSFCEGKDSREWVWHSADVTPSQNGALLYEIPEHTRACFYELSNLCEPEQILSTKVFFLT